MAILRHPDFGALFGPEARRSPSWHRCGARNVRVSGQIDRLAVTEDAVLTRISKPTAATGDAGGDAGTLPRADGALPRGACQDLSGPADRLRAGLDRTASTDDAPGRIARRRNRKNRRPPNRLVAKSTIFAVKAQLDRKGSLPRYNATCAKPRGIHDAHQSHRPKLSVRRARFEDAGHGGFLGGMVRTVPDDRAGAGRASQRI